MDKKIPSPLLSLVADAISELETHASLDSLFHYADAPGEPPEGSKKTKALEWLRRINKTCSQPTQILGKLIEDYMESPKHSEEYINGIKLENYRNPAFTHIKNIKESLNKYGFQYVNGGVITDGTSTATLSLEAIIRGKDMPSIHAEFDRAMENTYKDPREAILAACNVLESVCKTYIEDEGLTMPAKKDILSVWKVIKNDLGMDISKLHDQDLTQILSGLFSTVHGIASLRTHASAAHAEGRTRYNIKPRHARLAINSAHTVATFILETWNERTLNKSTTTV